MTQPSTTVPWHEVGIRISAHGILSREADHPNAIAPSDISEVFVRSSFLSPLVLVMPVISLSSGSGILFFCFRGLILPWWTLFLPLLLIGYAAHTMWYFCRIRRHIVFLSAPPLTPSPIRFYVTECAQEAEELVTAIHAIIQKRDS